MENGLQVQDYNSEELKSLVVFVKAGIASTSLDLRRKDDQNKEVDPQEMIDAEYVYGTVKVHRAVTESDMWGNITTKEITLEYRNFEEDFKPMVESGDIEALKYFSINEDGDLMLAKAKITTVSTKYSSNTPEEYKNQGANGTTAKIELCDPIDYKKYITEYVTSYGLLADLLTITDDTPVTLNTAHNAFNHQIVLTAEEQLIITETTDTVNYTEETQINDEIEFKCYDKNSNIIDSGSTTIPNIETIEYTVITTTKTEDRTFKLKISKVDNWYMYFEKEYLSTPKGDSGNGNATTTPISPTSEYPEGSTDRGNLNLNDQVIKDFISQKESQYSGGKCEVTKAIREQKTKTNYEGTSVTKKDKYSPESRIKKDRIKNVQILNGKPGYVDTDKDSFLYAYHHYRKEEQDLFLEQDAEERLFKLLDSNIEDGTNPTEGVSDIIKYLLYAYDGVDRGVTNLATGGDRVGDLVIVDETEGPGSASYVRPTGYRWTCRH